jgi:preprotein translocase subunit SecF
MNIQFLKYSKVYLAISIILVLASITSLVLFGLNFGIDLAGGSIIEVEFENRPTNQEIESKLSDLNLGEIILQPTGDNGLTLKTKEIDDSTYKTIISKFNELSPTKELSFESISPIISKELMQKTIILIIASLVALLVYIIIAFSKVSGLIAGWQYGVTSILTLAFDELITIGVIAVLGHLYGVQFNIPIITALLTILGYTINDKVIVFDRVRENFKVASRMDLRSLIDLSLNQIILRSISTGTCTLLMLFSIFILGEETLKYFAFTLIVGIVVGTLSSLFLAPLFLMAFAKKKA